MTIGTLTIASFASTASTKIVNADEAIKPKVKKPKVLETDGGVKYIELKKGEGSYPSEGDYVSINYIGILSNGTYFDTKYEPGKKPLTFRYGSYTSYIYIFKRISNWRYGKKQVVPGLEEVIMSMQPGGERTCTIPSELGYGKKGVCLPVSCIINAFCFYLYF